MSKTLRRAIAPFSCLSCWYLCWIVACEHINEWQAYGISIVVMLFFNEINTCALRLADIADELSKRKK